MPVEQNRPCRKGYSTQLLFINGMGRTVTIRHRYLFGLVLGGLGLATATTMLFAIAFTAHLAATTLTSFQLENAKSQLEWQFRRVKDDRDHLLAAVVIAEQTEICRQSAAAATTSDSTPVPAAAGLAAQGVRKEGKIATVAVEEFSIVHDRQKGKLEVAYKLVNTRSKGKPISGRTYVVLGPSHRQPPRSTRRPRSLSSGDTFSISRFKNIRIRVDDNALTSGVNSASVLVVAASGELLLEKRYPLSSATLRSS